MESAYVGIDLAVAKKKRLPVSICRRIDGRIVPFALRRLELAPPRGYGNEAVLRPEQIESFATEARAYVLRACEALSVTPVRIAIDAPSRSRDPNMPRRAAEAAMDAAGISCFTTPSSDDFELIVERVRHHLEAGGELSRVPHANQLWMLYGFKLIQALRDVAPCIEVYPQATVRAIGAGGLHKSKAGAVEAQLNAAARYTGWPTGRQTEPPLKDIAFAPAHDCLDAYLSAWVAALEPSERQAFGTPPDDVIWAPRTDKLHQFPERPITATASALPATALASRNPVPKAPARPAKSTASASTEHSRQCPACHDYTFKRWPFGWDAHAGHTCGGLTSDAYEDRKAEFKRRFAHLFKK